MTESSPNPDNIDEELVAYLDGELTPEESQLVEKRLGDDPEYRRRLRQLEHTWELLDELPANEPTSSFTKSTLEMVVTNATQEHRRFKKSFWTIPVRWVVFAGLPLGLMGLTYGLTHWKQNGPYSELVRDLPVIENIDMYVKAERIEFLEMLEQNGLFVESNVGRSNQ